MATTEPLALCARTGGTADDTPLPPDLGALLDPVVAEGMAAMGAVGLTLALQCAESPLYVKGYGSADLADGRPAAATTRYEVGSITKQFVAAEILVLQQQGRLRLGDAIGAYLPSLPPEWHPITVEQLLSHTGGVPDHFAIFRDDPGTPFDWRRDFTPTDLIAALLALDDRLVAVPGTTFSYSNTGYVILTAIIEQLSGQTLGTALDRDLFQPLDLGGTAFCSPDLPDLAVGYVIGAQGPVPGPIVPASFLSGAAGVCATAGDLIRWERNLVDGSAIGLAGFVAMSTPMTLEDGTEVPYGLGLHLDRLGIDDAVFHEGGTATFSSWLAYYPRHDLTIAVLSNSVGPGAYAMRDLVIALTWAARGLIPSEGG